MEFVGAEQVLRLPEPGLAYLRHDRAADIGLEPTPVAVQDGVFAGRDSLPEAELRVDATGCSIVPGLIDAHTHLPFVGWRAAEYQLKVQGESYEAIAASGGGIRASSRALAAAGDEEVLKQSRELAAEMLAWGTTSFECKSGYGLSIEAEGRALRLAETLAGQVPQRTTSTALLAHAVPDGYDADGWMTEVAQALPTLLAECEASALDIYVESVAFENRHLEQMAELARGAGLRLRCHVEQFATHRSVPVAIAEGAASVDHLACLHRDDVPGLAQSECAAVLLPGAEFLGDEQVAPARALADQGAICVLASDGNPGTSPIFALPLVIGVAVRRYKWTAKEAFLAATQNAAWVLGLEGEVGSIESGKRADLVLLDGPIEWVPYRLGHNPVVASLIDGRPVYIRPGEEQRFQAS